MAAGAAAAFAVLLLLLLACCCRFQYSRSPLREQTVRPPPPKIRNIALLGRCSDLSGVRGTAPQLLQSTGLGQSRTTTSLDAPPQGRWDVITFNLVFLRATARRISFLWGVFFAARFFCFVLRFCEMYDAHAVAATRRRLVLPHMYALLGAGARLG